MTSWTLIFKALANINRLKIIQLLVNGAGMDVGSIAWELKISAKATSKHLIILANLEVLSSRGSANHVFYMLNKDIPANFERAIRLFIK